MVEIMDRKIMPDKLQEATGWFSQLITWGWIIGLSSWGGAVSYLHRVDKYNLKFNLFKLVMEILTSAFVGVLTFLLCDAASLSWEITAAMVGISGHMGTRALFILEKRYENFLGGKDGNS